MEGGNEAASFLISLISALLPELNFGRSARFTELFAFPLGLKKKRMKRKEKKKRERERPSPYRSMCRGREKQTTFHQATRSSSQSQPARTYSLFRPAQTHKKLHACQQWKSWATWHLPGTLPRNTGYYFDGCANLQPSLSLGISLYVFEGISISGT